MTASGWLAYRGVQAGRHLLAARSVLSTLSLDVAGPDQAARVAEAARNTAAARAATRDPVWSLASRIPVLGSPLTTVAGLAEISDGLARRTLPDLLAASDGLAAVRGASGGGVPLDALESLVAPLSAADTDLDRARFALENLPSSPRIGKLDSARLDLLQQVDRLSGPVRTAAASARIGPGMLGAGSPRRYFVALQNRAELRPDGGLLGGFAEVVFDRGRLQVVRLGQNSDLPRLRGTAGGIDPRFLALHGNRGAGESWINTNLSPHFPDDAQAFAAMYAEGTGRPVDGVIALDGVALGALAGLGGQPLPLSDGRTIPPGRIADFLERGQYELGLGRDDRKDLVAEIGQQALVRLQSTPVQSSDVLRLLGDLAGDGHLKLASTRDDEQRELLRFPLAGAAGGSSPYAGVFVSNAAGSKLDTYLREKVTYSCDVQGQAVLEVALTNTAPARLPEYVTFRADDPSPPVPVGQNRVGITLVGDPGAGLGAVTLDGKALPGLEPSEVAGHSAWRFFLELPRGTTRTLALVLQGQGSQRPPTVQVQPMVLPPEVVVTPTC